VTDLNAEKAREIVSEWEKLGKVTASEYLEAKGYLACLEGPEVKAKDAEIERLKHESADWCEKWTDAGHELLAAQRELESECARSNALLEYVEHAPRCITSRLEEGEPTPDGGYRQKIAGKWYQARPVDERPKCDCGLYEAFAAHTSPKTGEAQGGGE
jgi:hypothetical protein